MMLLVEKEQREEQHTTQHTCETHTCETGDPSLTTFADCLSGEGLAMREVMLSSLSSPLLLAAAAAAMFCTSAAFTEAAVDCDI